MYRQGDILLVPTGQTDVQQTSRPAENGRVILARGEATGHHHSMDATTASLVDYEPFPLLVVTEATDLIHPEHAPISVAPGFYFVVRQREYEPQRHRYVQD